MELYTDAVGNIRYVVRTVTGRAGYDVTPPPDPALVLDEVEDEALCADIEQRSRQYTVVGGRLLKDGRPVQYTQALYAASERRNIRPLVAGLRQYMVFESPTAAQSAHALRALIRLVGAIYQDARER